MDTAVQKQLEPLQHVLVKHDLVGHRADVTINNALVIKARCGQPLVTLKHVNPLGGDIESACAALEEWILKHKDQLEELFDLMEIRDLAQMVVRDARIALKTGVRND